METYGKRVEGVGAVLFDLDGTLVISNEADGKPGWESSPILALLACLERTELEPHQCLQIGDTPYDGQAAYDAGMKSLAVDPSQPPDMQIESHSPQQPCRTRQHVVSSTLLLGAA